MSDLDDSVDQWDLISTESGQLVKVHGPAQCLPPCAIHSPSGHALSQAELRWRPDRGIFERICPSHEKSHPDVDSLAYVKRLVGENSYESMELQEHDCCGCC